MSRKILAIPLIAVGAMVIGSAAQAGLVVTSNQTANDLVNTLLAGSSGITFSNAQVIGGPSGVQQGTFTGGNSAALGFDTGIVLSSGLVLNLPLTSSGSDTGADNNLAQAGDAKLDAIVGAGLTHDAAVLKFDFVPAGNQVKFSFVFGSTEYNEFVNSEFNDVFAFFVNDVNKALIPGTSTPVAINNVNCGGPVDGPTSAGSPGGSPVSNCDKFINNRNPTTPGGATVGANELINLGGMTQVFGFVADVNPNVTNTMYIAIADTSDDELDSAVFLAGGTFSTCGGPGQPSCSGGGTAVLEPATLALLGVALAGMGLTTRRRLN